MSATSLPPGIPPINNQPVAVGDQRPQRQYAFQFKLPRGEMGRVQLAAIDHVSALTKFTAWACDQPFPIVELMMKEIEPNKIVPVIPTIRRG